MIGYILAESLSLLEQRIEVEARRHEQSVSGRICAHLT